MRCLRGLTAVLVWQDLSKDAESYIRARTFQSFEEQLRHTDHWLDSLGEKGIDQLLEIAASPPAREELETIEQDEFMVTLGELLCRAAERHPNGAVPQLVAHLGNDQIGQFVADALAATGAPAAYDHITRYIMDHEDLAAGELLPLVEAVAELDGPAARTLLVAVRNSRTMGGADEAQLINRIDELLSRLS